MSSTIIAAYAVFCVIVFAVINMMIRRKRNDHETELIAEHESVEEIVNQREEITLPQDDDSSVQVLQSAATTMIEEVEKPVSMPEQKKQTRASAPAEAEQPAMNAGVMLTILIIGMFVSILNQTVINIVLPELITEFNMSTTTGQWLSTGFMLVNGILVPISVYLVQTFTYRKLFLAAMMFFTVGSIVCAVATNFPIMMTGRVIQAVGAGILMPIGMNIFMMLFPPAKRGMAMGLLGVALILAPAVGPTIAGWLVQNYTWNIMFYGMFALGLIIFFVALRFFTIEQSLSKPKFDVIGAVASTIGLGTLLYGFSEAGAKGWGSAEVVSMLVIGTIGLICFVMWELKSETKLLDLTIFKIPAFSFTMLINILITMTMYGGMLLLPVYLQNIRGFTAIESGLLLLPGSLLMGLLGPFAGRLFDRYGIRPLAIFGLLIITYSTYEYTHLSMDTSYAYIMAMYTLRSFGMAFIMMPMLTAGMNVLPMNQIADGTAAQNTLRSVAGSIGTAILVTVMTRQSAFHAADYANEVTAANPVLHTNFTQVGQGLASLAHVSAQTGTTLETALLYGQVMKLSTVAGINDAFWAATILSGLSFVLSLFLHSPKKHVKK
ncbi:DHA2 family efflux MFS transporter permease subunit [Ectobacillus panaciterrae]|uniref:DHA2 family efflux MFS transporter permease subunit n=1 Tax=Ectobacillus panaciterrae TaxID=363872 RepID=UPI0004100D99|nr:DHA2 family efflux MFS transporter permease subunit [Ectobacillus panaciterrae]